MILRRETGTGSQSAFIIQRLLFHNFFYFTCMTELLHNTLNSYFTRFRSHMSNDEQSSNGSTWSTTRRNIISAQKAIKSNKVMQVDSATNTSHQKLVDIPVYSDATKTPLLVYWIDINNVSYNFDNVRLWKYKKRKMQRIRYRSR